MEIVYDLLVILHFIGLASLLGGFLVQLRSTPRVVNPAMLHGALTQLVTGLALVGLAEAALDYDVNHVKVGIKLAILLVITVLVWVNRGKDAVSTGVWAAIGGLTIVNTAIAVLV
ncbi:MAG: hypothetical protein MUD13_04210 [Candidatus Nanopelagicales bacterium]|jgi:hypothetical protein|nr:hypothetical protein [Candidatus Nanopelagicales bacterium]